MTSDDVFLAAVRAALPPSWQPNVTLSAHDAIDSLDRRYTMSMTVAAHHVVTGEERCTALPATLGALVGAHLAEHAACLLDLAVDGWKKFE